MNETGLSISLIILVQSEQAKLAAEGLNLWVRWSVAYDRISKMSYQTPTYNVLILPLVIGHC